MTSLLKIAKKTGLGFTSFLFINVVAIIIVSVSTLYTYRLTGDLSDAASIGDTGVLLHLILFLTLLTVVRGVFGGLSELYIERFGASAGYNLRQIFMKHFLHAPFACVEDAGSGESLSIFSNDIPAAERLITTESMGILRELVSFFAAFAFLLFISPFYTAASFGMAVVIFIFVLIISQPIDRLSRSVSEKEAGFNAVVNDSLQNISTITAFSLQDVLEDRFLAAFREYFVASRKLVAGIVLMAVVSFLSMMGPLVLIFTVLGIAVINGNMYLADFVAFSLTITMSAASLMAVGQAVGRFMDCKGRAKRYLDYTSHEHEEENGSSTELMTIAGLSFSDVSFGYKDDVPVLEGVSFHIEPGSKVALVGGSGSGKSTILKLLLGLYAPSGGEILIGGKNIAEFGKKDLRQLFSYVPQDSFLFPESIGKNITLEDKPGDPERLYKACIDAGILEFVESLPGRFDDVLTEMAENISGGQKQRIAMARAFYKNAKTILFDEATSSLDPQTESDVLANLFEATKGKTVVMVAHRAMSIAGCDKIIVMSKGKVSGVGTHDELMESCPVYQNLYKESNSGKRDLYA